MIQGASLRAAFHLLGMITFVLFPSFSQEEAATAMPDLPAEAQALLEEFQDDVLQVGIIARVLGEEGSILWNMEIDELTVPGRGVEVRLNGQNIVVEVEFTPYRQQDETIMLLAQGQTWISSDEEQKLRYQTSLKSIPVSTGEPVVFYPLGVHSEDGAYINLELEIVISNFLLVSADEAADSQSP